MTPSCIFTAVFQALTLISTPAMSLGIPAADENVLVDLEDGFAPCRLQCLRPAAACADSAPAASGWTGVCGASRLTSAPSHLSQRRKSGGDGLYRIRALRTAPAARPDHTRRGACQGRQPKMSHLQKQTGLRSASCSWLFRQH